MSLERDLLSLKRQGRGEETIEGLRELLVPPRHSVLIALLVFDTKECFFEERGSDAALKPD